MKYKVGDKVRIVSKKNDGLWNAEGKMDKWLGKEMTIRSVGQNDYHMVEDRPERPIQGGWYWSEHMVAGLAAPEESSIMITCKGREVTAVKRNSKGKETFRAVAKCAPEDTFDFMVGAKLALDRLTKSKKFNPHLICGNTNYGVIGEKADFTAIFGEELFVGDTVESYSPGSGQTYPAEFVCREDGKFSVMAVASERFNHGVSNRGWQIRKVGSYKDLTHGQKVESITAILKED